MKYSVSFDVEFKPNPFPGTYVVVEGINASGKSTQVEELKKYFEAKGRDVVVTSEPNDSLVIGSLIRDILLGKVHVPAAALQYLYTADRVVNHETVIIPALKLGKVVLCSRSFWSAVVYGVLDKGGVNYRRPDADLLLVAQGVLSMYHKFILADYTFYLDVSVATIMKRMKRMRNINDLYETQEKLSQLIAGYKWVTKEFQNIFIHVDGEKSVEDITREMCTHFIKL